MAEFAGDDRVIADYLVAEVLDRQPPRLRAFLLRTALVDRVCGSLADALTGESNGADTLATLERTNGFVLGVDGHREWFRYHRLFAKLLRTRAERELAAKLPDLHARAARWYAARGASVDALGHAVQAREWDLAVEVVADHWFDLYVRGDAAAVRALLSQLPPDRLEQDAELAAALACAALDVGDTEAAERHLEHAEQVPVPEPRRRRYLETRALAGLAKARLEGDFEAALRGRGRAAGRGRPARRRPDDGSRQALVHAMLGETAMWAHKLERAGEELQPGRHAGPRPPARLPRAVGAELPGAAGRDGPRAGGRAGARRAGARARRARAAGRSSRRRRARTPASRCTRSTTCGPPRPPSISSARALRPRCCAAATWTS